MPAHTKVVFVSHAQEDERVTIEIVRQLEASAIPCWIAPRDIPLGASWPTAIVEAIPICRAMIIVVSHAANKSPQVAREVNIADAANLGMISFRVENIALFGDLRFFLSNRQWLDAFDVSMDQAVSNLVTSLRGLVLKEEQPTAPSLHPLLDADGERLDYRVGRGIEDVIDTVPYERTREDPLYRRLKILTRDPAVSIDQDALTINVPYEPLQPGPIGSVLEVDDFDGSVHHGRLDLDDPRVTLRNGVDPSISDHRFHQQMVYAVCSVLHTAFEEALGRRVIWGGGRRLRIRPFVPHVANAYYDATDRMLNFGYFRPASTGESAAVPLSPLVFTSLIHDIVVHETCHALIHAVRPMLFEPSSEEVIAFHEAFADVIAVLQHFTYAEDVKRQLSVIRDGLSLDFLPIALAKEWGYALRDTGPLRASVGSVGSSATARNFYELGALLVEAIFRVYVSVFARRAEGIAQLIPGSTSNFRENPAITEAIASIAADVASSVQRLCIRALDYCPPVDITFDDYLRAVITADAESDPDDSTGVRKALISSFRRMRLGWGLDDLFEHGLLLRRAETTVRRIEGLSFSAMRFNGDPSNLPGKEELVRQARALALVVTRPEYADAFGIVSTSNPAFEPPCIQFVRVARRPGRVGSSTFDVVAEVTQVRSVPVETHEPLRFVGGATIILDADGVIRYVIRKHVMAEDRVVRQAAFVYRDDRGNQ